MIYILVLIMNGDVYPDTGFDLIDFKKLKKEKVRCSDRKKWKQWMHMKTM